MLFEKRLRAKKREEKIVNMAKIVYNKRRRTELWLVLGVLFGLFSIGYIRTVNGLPENNETITTSSTASLMDTSSTSTTISSLSSSSSAATASASLETTTVNTVTEKKIIDEGMFVIFQSILV